MIKAQSISEKKLSSSQMQRPISVNSRNLHRLLVLFSFIFLLLIGSGTRLATYDRYLPYQDRTDESVYQVTSLHRRGVERNNYVEDYYASQAPGYIWLTMLVQPFVENGRPWTLLADYLHMQKLIAVLIGILTTALVMRLGWLLGGTIAGWFAGLVWAFSSLIVDRNNQALPDPFVYLTVAASLVMVIHALRSESPTWLFGSLMMGIAAIYFKYTPWYIVIPWGIVALVLLRRNPRRMFPWLTVQVLVGALCAWFLLVNYAALDLPNREVETFRGEGLIMAFTPWRNYNNFWSILRPIGEIIFLATMLLGLLAYWYSRRRKGWVVNIGWYGTFLIYGLIGLFMISSFTNVWEGSPKYRHTMPVTIAIIGLWSAAIAQIVHALMLLRSKKLTFNLPSWAPSATILGMALLFVIPNIVSNAHRFQRYHRVFTHNILWSWTDQNIPLEGRIMTRSNDTLESVWNRWWGGYDGKKPFEWWHESDIPQNTPVEYVDRGIMYFAITEEDLKTGYDGKNKNIGKFVNQLVHVKTIPNNAPELQGPTIHFYRMIPPEVETNVIFDNRITLVGYDLVTDNLQPGGSLVFRPYWRATNIPRSNYSMFIHLYPEEEDQIVVQHDGSPAQAGRLTLTWTDPDELYIGEDVDIQLPENLTSGNYRLVIGLYDYLTGERLEVVSGEDFYAIDLKIESN